MSNGREVTITIGNVQFGDVRYDEGQDSLHLAVGQGGSRQAVWSEQTLEGHTLHYGADGALVAATLCDVRLHLSRNGGVTITPPRRFLERSDLEGAL